MQTWTRRLLCILGVLLITAGLLAGVANRELLDGRRFAQHVDAVRADPQVARLLGLEISNRVIEQEPELVALRPLLESAAASTVASPALGPVVRATVAPLHQALVTGRASGVLLTLADIGAVLVSAINTLDPRAGAVLPADLDVRLSTLGAGELSTDVVALAHRSALFAWLLPLLGLGCLLGAGLLGGGGHRSWADGIRRGLIWVAGVLTALLLVSTVVVRQVDTRTLRGALTSAVWHELDGALWWTTAMVGAAALLLWLVKHPDFTLAPGVLVQRGARWFAIDLPLRQQVLRSGVLALLGVGLVAGPLDVLAVLLVGVGLLLVALAARGLGEALLVWLVQVLPGQAARIGKAAGAGLASGVASGVALALFAAILVIGAWPSTSALPSAGAGDDRCNGRAELCERPYDQVSHPGTHNSMAAADGAGWFLSEQPTGVIGQLEDGVRVFLVDAWPGQRTDRPGVIANTRESRETALAAGREAFGPAAMNSALRLVGGFNLEPHGEVRTFLCHALCELGSTEWTPLMRQVRSWLDTHPREVVTFIVEDYVSPADTAKVITDAGLLPYVHTQPPDEPWPSLGEMIDSGKRLVMVHERSTDPAVPWLLGARTWVQDTPFTFHSVDDFSCRLLRGTPSAPLFLVNHWLSNFQSRIADGRLVNSREVLLDRLRTCESERERIPNFVAVNNYDEGDLFEVVDEVNGVAP